MCSSVAALRQQVRQADAAYRAGAPLMTDAEFDQLLAQLRALAPHAPELLTPGGGTALLSLDNGDPTIWWGTLPSKSVLVQPKIDGVALALRYENGKLAAAWTRSGKCALAVARLVPSIPQHLRFTDALNVDATIEVRGELYGLDNKQSTPAAALRRKQPSGDGLAFTAYTLPSAPISTTELDSLRTMERLGFDVPDALICTKLDEVLTLHRSWLAGTLFNSWPTDGIVARTLSHADQHTLGSTPLAPRWALALKR